MTLAEIPTEHLQAFKELVESTRMDLNIRHNARIEVARERHKRLNSLRSKLALERERSEALGVDSGLWHLQSGIRDELQNRKARGQP